MFRMEADGVTQEWTFWGARGEKLETFAMVYGPYGGTSMHPYQPVFTPLVSYGVANRTSEFGVRMRWVRGEQKWFGWLWRQPR